MDANGNPSKIYLVKSQDRFEEGTATVAVRPGMLVQNAAEEGELKPHVTAGGPAIPQFALEDSLQGNGIDVLYPIGARVFTAIAAPGDVMYALLADGENVVRTDYLTSAGNGALREASGTQVRIAEVLEDVDNSETNSAIMKRVKVRIL